jgi:hypothetical protein
MSNQNLERLTWVLIYSGLLLACLGVFVRSGSDGLGWTLIVAGLVEAAVGALLIVVRARRDKVR